MLLVLNVCFQVIHKADLYGDTDVDLVGSALLFPDEECIADPDDDFLVIQRATNAVSIIYNDLFSYSRSEFINYLSVNYDIKELR